VNSTAATGGFGMNTDGGTVEFKNTGTMVHTATWVPGSGNLMVSEDAFLRCGRGNCTNIGVRDTGGITPGQSVVVGIAYQPSGTIQFSSATDCPTWGNNTPGFNCAPSTLTVKAVPQDSITVASMEGTVHHNADGSLALVRTFNSTKGSPKSPLTGSVTVTIDDENGNDPTTMYVLAGTIVTWVNNGQVVHSVRPRSPAPPTVDWVNLLDSGGLAPGATYSYTFDCGADPGCRHSGAANSKFYSVIIDDRIQGAVNGNSPINWDSRFMQRIVTVAVPS
jgi:plastocyanin